MHSCNPIELPIDPVEGIPLDMPLVYFHGHVTPSVNVDLYKALVKELAQILERQFAGNVESRAAGMVINTMGWIEGVGYELLLHAIDTFNATVVLVLGQEKLWSMLRDVLKNKANVDVVKLQKSGGVVSRNAKVRQKARAYRIREYFYGLANDLSRILTLQISVICTSTESVVDHRPTFCPASWGRTGCRPYKIDSC
ncbi:UNVERIFIED_CONTAM: protein CLP1 [Sesamum calycinum]|uniref:Protein CLP1 n=1 Tax=Sesamum calycinum TaxID=2727403 RepID=A0AAW2QW87_9LAMI